MENEKMQFSKGEIIFRKGDVQFWFYEILSGSVYIYTNYGEEGETLLTEMKPGQTFGEMSVLDFRPRSATVVAASDTEVLKIDKNGFDAYIAAKPDCLLKMMKQLSDRTRELTNDYREALHTAAQLTGADRKDKGLIARIARFAKIWKSAKDTAHE